MSKLSDYSKFDHLDSDTEHENGESDGVTATSTPLPPSESDHALPHHRAPAAVPTAPAATGAADHTASADAHTTVAGAAAAATPAALGATTTRPHATMAGRYVVSYRDQKVYEWEQSLEEVILYVAAPMEQLPREHAARYLVVDLLPDRLRVGLKGAETHFIDERTFDKIKVKESSWYLDEGVITIVLSKCFRGQTWEGVLCGHATTVEGRQTMQETIDPVTKQAMQKTLMLERFHEENPGFDFRDAQFNGEVPDPRTFMGGVRHF